MCHDMKWTNQIITTANKFRKVIYITMAFLQEILDYKDIQIIYLTLNESLITVI